MALQFNKSDIPSIALTDDSRKDERDSAQTKLKNDDIKFIFTVDLYNEGVDIPEVNTVMFLRPTESLTVFLQQLGRGLRLCEGKLYIKINHITKKKCLEIAFPDVPFTTMQKEVLNEFISDNADTFYIIITVIK